MKYVWTEKNSSDTDFTTFQLIFSSIIILCTRICLKWKVSAPTVDANSNNGIRYFFSLRLLSNFLGWDPLFSYSCSAFSRKKKRIWITRKSDVRLGFRERIRCSYRPGLLHARFLLRFGPEPEVSNGRGGRPAENTLYCVVCIVLYSLLCIVHSILHAARSAIEALDSPRICRSKKYSSLESLCVAPQCTWQTCKNGVRSLAPAVLVSVHMCIFWILPNLADGN